MKFRHCFLLLLLAALLFFFVYCLARNHTLLGYGCAALSLGLMVCTGWLLLFPKLSPVLATGQHKTASADCFYTDPVRMETYANDGSHRELAVTFWYPADYGEDRACPLVVFSHGSLGIKNSNETLYRELASHGYVVCAMDHTYQCFKTRNSKGKKIGIDSGFMKEVMTVNPSKKPAESYPYQAKWMDIRMGDIHLVLDTALEKAASGNDELLVYRLINPDKIALIGHSLGGSGVLGVGRVRDGIAAVIALESPFMYDIKGVNDGKFTFDQTPYPVPVLNAYSDTGWTKMHGWDLYAENVALLRSTRADVQNIYLAGTNHLGLTDLSMQSPFLSDLFSGCIAKNRPQKTMREINKICLAFLDRYLKD